MSTDWRRRRRDNERKRYKGRKMSKGTEGGTEIGQLREKETKDVKESRHKLELFVRRKKGRKRGNRSSNFHQNRHHFSFFLLLFANFNRLIRSPSLIKHNHRQKVKQIVQVLL